MNLPPFSPPRRRGIYILPNLFTTAALFCGYYAIVQAMNKSFEAAAIAIFVAMVLDGLDGRIARLTGTQSEFGVQYDSLSDMVSFGIAPALVVYQWALMPLEKVGWIVSFIYCSGAALRLARFNTNVDVVDKRFFQGLPSPAAAALIAGLVWVCIDNKDTIGSIGTDKLNWLNYLACVLTLVGGISMVSNFPFWSGKSINLRKSVPFIGVIVLVLLFVLGAIYPPGVFFGLFIAYAFSGYAISFWRWRRRRAAAARAEEEARPKVLPPVQKGEAEDDYELPLLMPSPQQEGETVVSEPQQEEPQTSPAETEPEDTQAPQKEAQEEELSQPPDTQDPPPRPVESVTPRRKRRTSTKQSSALRSALEEVETTILDVSSPEPESVSPPADTDTPTQD